MNGEYQLYRQFQSFSAGVNVSIGSRAAENDSSEVGPFYPQLQKLIGRISDINGDFTTPTNSQFFMFKLL